MEEEKQDLKEEVQERQVEMFLLTDFEVVKKLKININYLEKMASKNL